jgi:hypothetical protein
MAMPGLQQLDLGYGDDEMTRYLWDYCVSRRGMMQLQSARPEMAITMSADHSPIAHEVSEEQHFTAVANALTKLATSEPQESDGPPQEGIREHARQELAAMTAALRGTR